MPLEVRFLPAAEGDAIWIRWGDDLERQMLVDMGKEQTGLSIRRKFEALPPDRRGFELLVVTHIDGDHIGGVLTGLAEATPLERLAFNDVWFNGWAHLNGRSIPRKGAGLEPMGAAKGERLISWLTGPWNEAFGRGPVVRETPLKTIVLPGGLSVTVLGPTSQRLLDLRSTWQLEVELAIAKGRLPAAAGLEPLGRQKPTRPALSSLADLRVLADEPFTPDPSKSNGTSITLLLEWEKRRVLLTGDAFDTDVVEGLALLDEPLPVPIDIFKLPHHGSDGNVSRALVRAVAGPAWVVSTDGAKHYHPDAAAVARVLVNSSQPQLLFNVPSEFNQWWCDDTWRSRFGYSTETGTAGDGLTVTLEPG